MTRRIPLDPLRAAVHAARLGLWSWEIPSGLVAVSTSWKQQLGEVDNELELELADFEARVHPEDLEPLRRRIEAVLAGASDELRCEVRLRHVDGSWRWMLALASLVRDETGQALHLAGSHVDISEQKRTATELARANAALRDSNRLLEAAQRLARVGHWERDLEDDVLVWSDEVYRLFGREPGKPLCRRTDFVERIHPEDRGRVAAAVETAIQEGRAVQIEFRLLRADGQLLHLHGQVMAERDTAGRPRRIFGVVQDVSERHQAEASLRAAERQLRTIIDGVPDFISRFDCAGRFQYISGAVARTTGADLSGLIGKTAVELGICTDPASDRALTASVARVAAGGAAERLEVVFRTPGGPRPFEIRHVPETDDAGHVVSVLGIGRDLGERKAAERQLYTLNYALDHISEGIYLMNGESTRFVYVNEGAARALGYSREELTGGMSIFDIDPVFTAAKWAEILPMVRAQRHVTVETIHRTRSGTDIPVEVTGNFFELDGQDLNMAVVRDISERKAAEAALRESEALYRGLVTGMAEGMVCLDASGRITAVNPAAELIEGRTAAEMIGLDCAALHAGAVREDGTLFPPEQHPSRVTLTTGAAQANVVMGIERPDGSRAWLSINAQPLVREGKGLPYAVVTTFHDITAVKDSERQLRTLADNSPDVIVRVAPDGRYVFANRTLERLLGGPPSPGGDPLERQLAPRVAEVYASGRPLEAEVHLSRADGDLDFNVRLVPELDDAGDVTSVLGVARDVTEARRIQSELAAREAHLRAVIETAVDAIVTTDETGLIQQANTAAERIFGFPVSELVGQNVEILLNGSDAAPHTNYLARALHRAEDHDLLARGREVVARRRDGTLFPAELGVSEFFVGPNRRFTGILRDISERKRMERMISESELRLRTSVAYEIHDTIGQLLAGGRFLAQNLVSDVPADLRPRASRVVEILTDTLTKIRAFSKNLEVLGTSGFSFAQALCTLAEKVSAVYELGCRLQLETQDEPGLAQRRQAYLVVEEAVANAIRHSACTEIVLGFAAHGGRYRLTIEDDGVGLDGGRTGDGMGLGTMRYRAQLLGGSLEIRRRQPRGTAVVLDWPDEDR